jgi:DNA-binding protein
VAHVLETIFLVYAILYLYFIQEKHAKEIVLKAMGQAISKTVAIAEILKVISLQDVFLLFHICSLKFMQITV